MPTPRKQKVKKKVATRPQPKQDDATEFDAWADAQKAKRRPSCHTCRQPGVAATIQGLLQSCIRKRVYRFKIQDMREAILAKHPDADVGQRGLERHLRTCDRALYEKARGRFDG